MEKKQKNKKRKNKYLIGGFAILTISVISFATIYIYSNKKSKELDFYKEVEKISNLKLKNEKMHYEDLEKHVSNYTNINEIFEISNINPQMKINFLRLEYLENIELTKIVFRITYNDKYLDKEFLIDIQKEDIFINNEEINVFLEEQVEFEKIKNNIETDDIKNNIKLTWKNKNFSYTLKNLFVNKKLYANLEKINLESLEKKDIAIQVSNVLYKNYEIKNLFINVFNKFTNISFLNNEVIHNWKNISSNNLFLENIDNNYIYIIEDIYVDKVNNNTKIKVLIIEKENTNNYFYKNLTINNLIKVFPIAKIEELKVSNLLNKNDVIKKFKNNTLKISDFEFSNNFDNNKKMNILDINIFNDNLELNILMKNNNEFLLQKFKLIESISNNTFNIDDEIKDIGSINFLDDYKNKFSIYELKKIINEKPNYFNEILDIKFLKNKNLFIELIKIEDSKENFTKINVEFWHKNNPIVKVKKEIILSNIIPSNIYAQKIINEIKNEIVFEINEIKKYTYKELENIWFSNEKNKILKDILKINHKNEEIDFDFIKISFSGEEKNILFLEIKIITELNIENIENSKLDFKFKIENILIKKESERNKEILNEYIKFLDNEVIKSENLNTIDYFKFNEYDAIKWLNNLKVKYKLNDQISFEIISLNKVNRKFEYSLEIEIEINNTKIKSNFTLKNFLIPILNINHYHIGNGIYVNLEYKLDYYGYNGYVILSSTFGENKKLYIPSSAYSHNIIGIEKFAFFDKEIQEVTIGKNIVNISISSFKKNKIKEILIPESVKYLSEYSFAENEIKEVVLTGDYLNLNSYAFAENKVSKLFLSGYLYSDNIIEVFNKNHKIKFFLGIPLRNISTISEIHYINNSNHKSIINKFKATRLFEDTKYILN